MKQYDKIFIPSEKETDLEVIKRAYNDDDLVSFVEEQSNVIVLTYSELWDILFEAKYNKEMIPFEEFIKEKLNSTTKTN